MVIYIFLKFGMVKVFETLQTVPNVKMNIFQIKIFLEITLLLFIIYSFIQFKVSVSLPKSRVDSMSAHCARDHPIKSRPTAATFVACRERDRLPCWPPIQSAGVTPEVNLRTSMQARKRASKKSILALKPRADVTRSPSQRYQWSHKKNSCPTEFFLKKVSLKVSMVHLAVRMHCNWSSDHTIDHISIELNRLTIQLVFNEVSLFTFSNWTHGFDVRVPENYLKMSIWKKRGSAGNFLWVTVSWFGVSSVIQ